MTDQFNDGTSDQPPGSDAPTPPSGVPRQPPAPQPAAEQQQPTAEQQQPAAEGQQPTAGEQQPAAGEQQAEEPPADAPPRRGQVRYQDPATAHPRPPSLAEQRARQVADRKAEEVELAETAAAERKRKLRRRLLIGSGVTVGVVAIVSIWYAASRPKEVTAYCVADDDVVNDDSYCDEQYVSGSGGYHSGGFFFIGGRQYHYYYGGNPTPLGQRVSGGSTVLPQGKAVTTRSGKSIQRGGFGIRGGSSKSSGS